MASVEYDYTQETYKLWSKRTSTVGLTMDQGVETATIDIDGTGRMWLASAGVSNINVRWSDAPYNNWSAPITIATGVDDDDICAVIAMPGKIGVLWSNQNTNRFGFKMHQDGAAPGSWFDDEVPASQSAQNVGNGMADDHLNIAIASDGTLYCAVKTEYGTRGYPEIALLVRRPNGSWDNLYGVAERGTRPIVILNESIGKVKVIYTSSNSGGNILYKESPTSSINFSTEMTLMSGIYNDATSSKANYTSDVVVMATSSSSVVGVLASDQITTTVPTAPVLASPANNASNQSIPVVISWEVSQEANSYQAQVSTTSNFSSTIYNQSNIQGTSASISSLSNSTTYYWKVRASNASGTSDWSTVWSFNTAETPSTQYALAVSTVGGGAVTKSPEQSAYAASTQVTLTATPQQGFAFAGWSGDAAGTQNPLTLTMDRARAVTATFTAISSQQQVSNFTLVNANNERDVLTIEDGAVISLASLPSSKVNIRANTSPGTVGSVRLELSGTQSRTYTDNKVPYALFGDNGNGNYYYGNWNPPATGTYTLRATPYTGANGTGTAGTPMTITFTVVDSQAPGTQYALSVSTVGGGAVVKSPDQSAYAAGTQVTLTATPQQGFAFAGWSGDAAGTQNPLTLTMDRARAVTATFTAISSQQQVSNFTLVNANNERDVLTIEDGAVISLASLPSSKVNIRANTSPGTVGSVRLELSGTQSRTYTDNKVPYALFGDNGNGNYYYGNWNPPATGTYTLRATPYTGANGTGTAGTPLTITFQIVASSFAGSSSLNLEMAEFRTDVFRVYPNPFTQKAMLNFTLQEGGDYSIALFDVKGMLLGNLQEGSTVAGELNRLEIDGTPLPKGLYFIKLQSNSTTKTLKLILDR
ncbi:T9SS type A sorting domain-containing protein [Pontibacter sp. HSC-36F09]|uniref:InlB B-repeat-containing protein n=1 Tax=Pontibacter sp. HSC-36F09 TaxID=2910966 RepID=UPI00209D9F01|nr:T9SS type A sorting domain-containing protein [Pontibacter sp. HSC-36F09]MCP2045568.1 putative repeat protein (TIGR02543 family) [Pontibacter sp. HSC-36F09]